MKHLFLLIILFCAKISYSQLQEFSNLKNNPKKIKTTKRLSNILFSQIYKFDNGKLIKEISKRNFKKSSVVVYKYDTLDNLKNKIELKPYKRNDTLNFVSYEYVFQNNKIVKIIKKYNHKIIEIKDSIVYNDKSKITGYIILNPSKKNPFDYFKEYVNITYNDEGLVKTVKYEEQNYKTYSFSEYKFEYYSNGDISKMIISQKLPNSPVKTETYAYKYDYDKNMNWTKKYILVNGKRKITEKRKIKY